VDRNPHRASTLDELLDPVAHGMHDGKLGGVRLRVLHCPMEAIAGGLAITGAVIL
jgi:hypothetical protein